MKQQNTLVLVNELYTLSTGSSTFFLGVIHSGCSDEEDALGASVMIDMLNRRLGLCER